MNHSSTPADIYNKNITTYKLQLNAVEQKLKNIGWLRFLIFIITVILIKLAWHSGIVLPLAAGVAGIAGFLYIISLDADAKKNKQNIQRLIHINEEEIKILQGNYQHRQTGVEYEPQHHEYAQDMDLFGANSLYQYLSRCTAAQASALLAKRLLYPLKKEDIKLQQKAIKELVLKINWRQQLYASGMEQPLAQSAEKKLRDWLQLPDVFTNPVWKIIAVIYSCFTLISVYLFLDGSIGSPIFSFLVLLFFLFAFNLSRQISKTYHVLSGIVAQAETLYAQIKHIENESFEALALKDLQLQVKSADAKTASEEILLLKNILERFDMRLNIFAFFFLNTFLLWDLHQVLALNKWKQMNKNSVSKWFTTIAQAEVSSSFAALSFNHPGWSFAEIAEKHFELKAENMGHPLIVADKMVVNDFSIQVGGQTSIITGSNMAGKSTFLRSLGCNSVLALAGSPVCAASFMISETELISSMRIADNLAESTSTFYAELKKLKTIIDKVNNNEPVFILLDEILRGTNSPDRHAGSRALIKQLVQKKAVSVIATHDAELAKMEEEYPDKIFNYHFDVQVNNNTLYFDYKIKDGISNTMNAAFLMKQIGIEL